MKTPLDAPEPVVGYPDTPDPVEGRQRPNPFSEPQVRASRLPTKRGPGVFCSDVQRNSSAWWRRGRRFVCPKGCGGGEITLLTRSSGAWCRCGRALVLADGKEVQTIVAN